MKERKWSILFGIVLMLFSCQSSKTTVQKVVTKVSDPFKDYTVLSIPRENLPLGANWIQGIGPSESGKGNIDLTNKKSLSTFNLSQEFKNKLGLALFSFIGIDEQYQRKVNLEIQKMSIVRPSSITDLGLIPGKSFLFEGIIIEDFSMKYDKGLGIDLEAKIETKLDNIDVEGNFGNTKNISVKGENVFLAYRVLKVLDVKNEKKETVKSSTKDNSFYTWNFSNYKLTYNKTNLNNCFLTKMRDRNHTYLVSESGRYGYEGDVAANDYFDCFDTFGFYFDISSENIYANNGNLFESKLYLNLEDFNGSIKSRTGDTLEFVIIDKRIFLYENLLNDEFIQDFIIIDKFSLEPYLKDTSRGKNLIAIGNDNQISIFRNRIRLITLESPNAPGY
ncbi:hypothetical protein [Ulvibacterium sp.]|uniref:hypothetical protein n=1 Tax=Ulvibacterium sp. TaxID=2665914 RepID=UPI00261816BC|nr:hypothetical protein [Ulvibacterium sp.]